MLRLERGKNTNGMCSKKMTSRVSYFNNPSKVVLNSDK